MILIIDSEKSSEGRAIDVFDELGFKSVVIAKTAEKAREIIDADSEKKQITLIIIDGEVNGINGSELCREIRKIESASNAYILLLISSIENKTAIEKAKHSGASDFAVKPYMSENFKKSFFKYIKLKSVLLIEDDPVIRQVVRNILANYAMEVIEVDDGINAHNLLNRMPPTKLVLMDIGLPNISGIKLVELIRKNKMWRKTPVIMLTASTDVEDVKKCLSIGANDYIGKPFKVVEFKERLSRYLSNAE